MNPAAHPATAGVTTVRPTDDTRVRRGPLDTAATPVPRDVRDADGMAVASFLLGLPGLLVLNFVLGPSAVVLSLVALSRGTRRRARAFLGLALGVADLVLMVGLTVADHGVIWSFS